MRGTVAKRIRKLVKRDFAGQLIKAYTEKEHSVRLVLTSQLDDKGRQIPKAVTPITITLTDGCQRNISQYIKRHYAGTGLFNS